MKRFEFDKKMEGRDVACLSIYLLLNLTKERHSGKHNSSQCRPKPIHSSPIFPTEIVFDPGIRFGRIPAYDSDEQTEYQ